MSHTRTKQINGDIKPIAFGSRYLNDTEKNYSISKIEFLAVVQGLEEKFLFYLYGKKVHLYTDHQAVEPWIKRNRSNQQHSERLTRWLNRLAYFDIAVQHIAGSNLIFINILSRNPVDGAAIEDKYEDEYVINNLTEHAELNAKYGSLFDSQSNLRTEETKKERKRNRNDVEQKKNQSQTHRTFQKKNHVNKLNSNENTTPGQFDISTVESNSNSNPNSNSNLISKTTTTENEMNRKSKPISLGSFL